MKKEQDCSRVQPRRDFLAATAVAGVSGAIGMPAMPAWAEQISSHDRGLSAGHFQKHLGGRFRLAKQNGSLNVRLAEVEPKEVNDDRPSYVRQQPFCLFFEMPGGIEFQEDIYKISHPQLGTVTAHVSAVDKPDHIRTLQVVFA